MTKTGTFNLKNWHKKHPHQYVNLLKATTHEGVIWKISDLDPRSKPFDGFYISDSPAFLVIWFHKWQRFFIIPVHRIPDQVSISYKWCEDRFDAHGLLPEVRKEYNI